MSLARVKSWIAETLTASDLNAEFDNILNYLNGTPAFGAASFSGLVTLTGGQIKFPATQVASSNVNTLDDYEEGTWTPTFTNLTVVGSPDAYTGVYVKIGQIVFYKMTFSAATSVATSTSTICNNFPFTALLSYTLCTMCSEDATKTAIGLGAGNLTNIIMGTMAATGKIHVSGYMITST